MYSIVVAAMLSTATPAPAFNGFFANAFFGNNCNGCSGSCSGCSGCSGCTGCSGCNGCCGGYGFLGIRDYWHDVFSRNNCNGCCGGGCCGGDSSCCGGGCCGGGCCGGMPMQSFSCYGGSAYSIGVPMGYPMGGEMAAPMMPSPMMAQPGEQMGAVPPQQLPQGPAPQPYQAITPPNRATIIVTLPADARLFVDGQQMTLTGPVRLFTTTDLTPGVKYSYTLKMEVDRNGKMESDTKTIDLIPGNRTQVHFAEPGSPGSPARISVKVPEGATLFVENQSWPANHKTIVTPALTVGEVYTYTLKLEIDRNGRKESQTKEVTFRSGAELNVEFDSETLLVAR